MAGPYRCCLPGLPRSPKGEEFQDKKETKVGRERWAVRGINSQKDRQIGNPTVFTVKLEVGALIEETAVQRKGLKSHWETSAYLLQTVVKGQRKLWGSARWDLGGEEEAGEEPSARGWLDMGKEGWGVQATAGRVARVSWSGLAVRIEAVVATYVLGAVLLAVPLGQHLALERG